MKECTGCEIPNALENKSVLNLRGVCKFSYLDRKYNIKYDSNNTISYLGDSKSVISYDFDALVWKLEDKTNPSLTAISEAPYRSFAIGNFNWTITNDSIMCNHKSYSRITDSNLIFEDGNIVDLLIS